MLTRFFLGYLKVVRAIFPPHDNALRATLPAISHANVWWTYAVLGLCIVHYHSKFVQRLCQLKQKKKEKDKIWDTKPKICSTIHGNKNDVCSHETRYLVAQFKIYHDNVWKFEKHTEIDWNCHQEKRSVSIEFNLKKSHDHSFSSSIHIFQPFFVQNLIKSHQMTSRFNNQTPFHFHIVNCFNNRNIHTEIDQCDRPL